MKKIGFLILTCLFAQFSNSQQFEELKLTRNGVAPVIISLENMNSEAAYTKALAWIEHVYDKPKEVIKENEPNNYLLIEAYKTKAWWYKSMGLKNYNSMLYEVAITFEENQFKFNYEIGQFYLSDDEFKVQYNYEMFFKKDGSIRSQYKEAVTSLEATMNNLLHSFYSYLSGNKFPKEQELNAQNNSQKNYIDELKELADLKEKGIITEEEFNELKARVLERVKKQ